MGWLMILSNVGECVAVGFMETNGGNEVEVSMVEVLKLEEMIRSELP